MYLHIFFSFFPRALIVVPDEISEALAQYVIANMRNESRLPALVNGLETCFGREWKMSRTKIKMIMANKHTIYPRMEDYNTIEEGLNNRPTPEVCS